MQTEGILSWSENFKLYFFLWKDNIIALLEIEILTTIYFGLERSALISTNWWTRTWNFIRVDKKANSVLFHAFNKPSSWEDIFLENGATSKALHVVVSNASGPADEQIFTETSDTDWRIAPSTYVNHFARFEGGKTGETREKRAIGLNLFNPSHWPPTATPNTTMCCKPSVNVPDNGKLMSVLDTVSSVSVCRQPQWPLSVQYSTAQPTIVMTVYRKHDLKLSVVGTKGVSANFSKLANNCQTFCKFWYFSKFWHF